MQIDELVVKYIALRDKKAAMVKKHKERVASIDIAMHAAEKYFLSQMNELKLTSLPTASGVPYQHHREKASIGDWTEFINWCVEGEHWEMLTKAVSKDAVKAYIEEHKDVPPGVKWSDEIVVNVLRKGAKAPEAEEETEEEA